MLEKIILLLDDYLKKLDENEDIDNSDLEEVISMLKDINQDEENFKVKITLCKLKLEQIIQKTEIMKEETIKQYKQRNDLLSKYSKYSS